MDTQQLAAAKEFNENDLDPAPALVGRVNVSPIAPRRQVAIPRGEGKPPLVVNVVDKQAVFCIPHEDLKARLASLAVRPVSERVLVYDARGELIARFENMDQAKKTFKAAGCQKKVDEFLAFQAKEQANAKKKSDALARALERKAA